MLPRIAVTENRGWAGWLKKRNSNILGQHACDLLGQTFSIPLLLSIHTLQTHLPAWQGRPWISPLPSLHQSNKKLVLMLEGNRWYFCTSDKGKPLASWAGWRNQPRPAAPGQYSQTIGKNWVGAGFSLWKTKAFATGHGTGCGSVYLLPARTFRPAGEGCMQTLHLGPTANALVPQRWSCPEVGDRMRTPGERLASVSTECVRG